MTISRRRFSGAISAAVALPAFVGRASAQGATIKVGMCAPVTGPAAESGRYAQIGAKLAVDAVNKAGGVLGKQVELIVEDDQTTNPGVVLAFSKLASQTDIVAFLGSIRSTPNARHGTRRFEGRQAGAHRRHGSGAHPHGQPLALPLSPQ
ncbi:ABC transporter substrate-binding protein [Variovorax sp. J22R133]|uniref:ABC transporter substrate-binding protein n=1 Tax=Variovorax brevis TaxID=3053503 RepID=UPI0025789FC7|nr:ABC transporter substrate-binding protein [Variovorax sp. J22R133]MDM0112781.1 ABC transporter substrate-binding protein [Variovorax sp. J22R133]